ncbi:TPA: hypothetical protein MI535_28870 [Klebsiella pneumoniae]|nr:hypothetical protein FAU07_26070 [Klebsiella pneumoniae subsp. pneumoniae]HBX4660129.1 hypothetical protein [Klebsiella pneumoniae]HBY3692899.1 hypothetical protein [Klebsiella pneumoniae]HBY6901634.1 hypothetical protein [Klebsiella pneumoniae]
MMSLWDALRMNMMISYQELVRTFPSFLYSWEYGYEKSSDIFSYISTSRVCIKLRKTKAAS